MFEKVLRGISSSTQPGGILPPPPKKNVKQLTLTHALGRETKSVTIFPQEIRKGAHISRRRSLEECLKHFLFAISHKGHYTGDMAHCDVA